MLRLFKAQIINTSILTMQEKFSNYFLKYLYGRSCSKSLKKQKKKSSYIFIKRQKQNLLTVMSNYFFEQKSLTKLNFELLLPNTSKGHIQEDETYKEMKKSDDEERTKPTTKSKFREPWQRKRPTKRDRNKKVAEKHTCHLP